MNAFPGVTRRFRGHREVIKEGAMKTMKSVRKMMRRETNEEGGSLTQVREINHQKHVKYRYFTRLNYINNELMVRGGKTAV